MDQFLDKYVFPYTGKYFGWAKKQKTDCQFIHSRKNYLI